MSSPVLAHIVGGGAVWPLWLTGAPLFGGVVAALASPERWRRACVAVAVVGLVATVVVYTLLPSSPPAPPGLTVRIAAPDPSATRVTSPVLVKVCGANSNLPGTGRLLSLSIDGRQVAEVGVDTAVLTVAAGTHTLRAELVTSQHVEYAPPVLTDETITVDGKGPLPAAPDCLAGP